MKGIDIHIAKVEYVENDGTWDGADGGRIKVRVHGYDKEKHYDDLPWAFPLLPKTFHVKPQRGECVLILTSESDNLGSQRYYIGPIISQPQFFGKDEMPQSLSLISTGKANPEPKISLSSATSGSFPDEKDVAVVGRGKEDVVLSYDKSSDASVITMRTGIRQEAVNDNKLKGNVVFNTQDPAYIQILHKPSVLKYDGEVANSAVNVVGGHINLMSNLDENISDNITKQGELVELKEFDNTVSKLSPAVKGDVLVELLILLKEAIRNHIHPWAGLPPCPVDETGTMQKLQGFDPNRVKSRYVHLS